MSNDWKVSKTLHVPRSTENQSLVNKIKSFSVVEWGVYFVFNRPWDIAQHIPRERISPTESFTGLVRGIKIFTFILIFVVLWIGATVGISCLLILTRNMRHVSLVSTLTMSYLELICIQL